MAANYPHFVSVKIDEYIEPIDRGDRYEDPLIEELSKRNLGDVTGGGSQLDDENRIEYVCLDVELANLDEALNVTREMLNKLGAPIGSELSYERDGQDVVEPLGLLEGLVINLDGINLPASVYEDLDFAAEYEKLDTALKSAGAGELRGVRQGNEETGIFAYGECADKIAAIVEPFVLQIPVLQNARLVFKRKDASKEPKETRLPILKA